jgi:PKD repeat protein
VDVSDLEYGSGWVQMSPPERTCVNQPGSIETCIELYRPGTVVTLSAEPSPDSEFLGWSGACSGTAPTCEVTVTDDLMVGAAFRGPQPLAVTVGGEASGQIAVTPPDAVCVGTPGGQVTCSYSYAPRTLVTLVATPAADALFEGWSGACAGQASTCQVTILDDASTTATFVLRNHPPQAAAGGPYASFRGQPIVFDGSGSADPDSDPLTYAWDFGDGTTGIGVSPSHAYATLGSFTVTLVVSDGTDSSAPAATTVTISNQLPVASAGGPYSAVRGQAISFDGSSSTDPDGDALTYAWDFGDGATGTGGSPSHAYTTLGSFTVTLVVSDGTESSAPATAMVMISNQSPVANAGGPYSAVRGQAIVFNGSDSTDPDGDALTYAWDFGDGTTGTGSSPSHAYATLGSLTVTLVVSDGTDSSALATATVTVSNQRPVANAGGPYSAVRGQAVVLNGSGSTDADGDALTYAWDFGDGTAGTGVSPSHAYTTLGSFTVTLVVSDGTESSAPATATVMISNQSSVANAGGPYSAVRGQAINFDGASSTDPDGDALTYAWDFGDGTTGTGVFPSHAYATLGSFTVTLVVSDGTDSTAPATSTVTISNQVPVASAGGPYSAIRGQAINFSGAGSSDPDGDALTHAWDFGDGATASGVSPSHAYTTLGSFTVTLVVSDGTDSSAPATSTVTVSNQVPVANAGGPYAAIRNQAVVFGGTGSTDADGDALTYAWDFGDGTTGTGVSPSHAYATLGTFTVTLVVSDGTEGSAPATATVTISNQSPVANAGGPYAAVRGQAIVFNAAGSTDPDGDALTYAWDFGDGTTGTGGSPSHAYPTLGSFTVALVVSDGTDSSAPATTTVTISNQAPVANAGGPYSAVRGQAISFDGSSSTDPDGDALTYAWDFGDGTTGTGGSPSHAYTTLGSFTVALVVSDGTDSSTPATTTVTVSNQPPVASAGGPYAAVRGEAISFNGSGSSDPDGDALTYAWDFGDGTTGTGVSPSHAYATLGSFTVTLVVSDGTDSSAPATTTVTVSNQLPVASAGGPYAAVRNQTITFSGASSTDPDGDALSYAWDFGDGSTGTGVSPSHAYATLGSFTVTLVVSDGTDSSAPATATVTVSNQAPVADPGGPYAAVRNQAISLNGSGSADPDGDALTYAWDFGDGTTGTGASPSHAYATLGSFTVTLVVSDGTDSSAPATTTVTVSNQLPLASAGGPYAAVRNQVISLNGSGSADPDGDALTYAWDFGDGTTGTGVSPSHAYATLGSFTVTLVVSDGTDSSAPAVTTVLINNLPPVVTLTAPAEGAVFAAPAEITLTADALDPDGFVAQVEFYEGERRLGVATSAPYSFLWSAVEPGMYTLTARATDDTGSPVVTAPVAIKVTATLAPTADAYVRDGSANANRNFGTSTSLTVRAGSSGSNRWTYVKFDLSSVPTVSRAKLRLFGALSATTSTVVQTAAYPVANTTWSETGITWNNKPASGTTALSTVTMVNNSTARRWYEWDVTAYLQQEKAAGRNVVTLVLKNLASSSPYDAFNSKEAASSRPEVYLVP